MQTLPKETDLQKTIRTPKGKFYFRNTNISLPPAIPLWHHGGTVEILRAAHSHRIHDTAYHLRLQDAVNAGIVVDYDDK